ncbi:uncharacterized protein LOC141798301 [Halichoeres trimaculatus]|uniref:uncharacterized protein LOC141798301 n=1 Tax=Halichoeres trimaculatus TaxID=147232 RepID=UPI003D9E09AF
MSVPFSNTHLRVPRGFGTLLEGLTREVLRDQPEDIPKYAAQYFEALLRQREESGTDPAEWAAKLEDRFYNNHAFKASGASQEKDPGKTLSKDISCESQTEDESSDSADVSNLLSSQPAVPKETGSTENTEEEEQDQEEHEENEITKKPITSSQKQQEESVNRPLDEDKQPDDLSGAEEEEAQTTTPIDKVDSVANEKGSSFHLAHDTCQSQLDPTDLFRGATSVDVCAQELGTAEDEQGDKNETVTKETGEREEKSEVDDPVEIYPYSGLANVDICATELEGIQGDTEEDDALFLEAKTSEPQLEITRKETLLSEPETPEDNQTKAEDRVEIEREEDEDTGESSGEIHESLASIEGGLNGNAAPKENSLVEISFEDVPVAQQTKEDGEKQPEEEDSAGVLDTAFSEMQQEEESEKVTAVEIDKNIPGAEGCSEPEMVVVKTEDNSGKDDMEMQEISDIMKVKTNHESDADREKESDETMSSLQFTPEKDEGKLEDGNYHENEEKAENLDDPDFRIKEKTDPLEGEEEESTQTKNCEEDQEIKNGGEETLSSQVLLSNASTPTLDAESETLETSQQLLLKEIDDSPRKLTESQPEDTAAEKEVTLREETSHTEKLEEEGKMDSCVQERSDEVCKEDSTSHTQSAEQLPDDHARDEMPLGSEKDTSEPEGNNSDKVQSGAAYSAHF